ncbi:MAG: hypothetical protein ACJ8FY_11370 [Gemmataceae bacterium]
MFTSWRNHPLYLIVLSLIIISGYFFRGPSGAYGDSLTKETYDSIQIDMGQDEVDDILGGINDPLDRSIKCVTTGKKMPITRDGYVILQDADVTWSKGDKSITVHFKDAQVASKSQKGLK